MGLEINFHIYKKNLHIHTYINIYISKSVDVYNTHTHIHTYICISNSVYVYTICVSTEHRNNMNIGQYYT